MCSLRINNGFTSSCYSNIWSKNFKAIAIHVTCDCLNFLTEGYFIIKSNRDSSLCTLILCIQAYFEVFDSAEFCNIETYSCVVIAEQRYTHGVLTWKKHFFCSISIASKLQSVDALSFIPCKGKVRWLNFGLFRPCHKGNILCVFCWITICNCFVCRFVCNSIFPSYSFFFLIKNFKLNSISEHCICSAPCRVGVVPSQYIAIFECSVDIISRSLFSDNTNIIFAIFASNSQICVREWIHAKFNNEFAFAVGFNLITFSFSICIAVEFYDIGFIGTYSENFISNDLRMSFVSICGPMQMISVRTTWNKVIKIFRIGQIKCSTIFSVPSWQRSTIFISQLNVNYIRNVHFNGVICGDFTVIIK